MAILGAIASTSTLLLIGGALWTLHRAGRLHQNPVRRGLAFEGRVEVPLSVAIGWVRDRDPLALPFLATALGAVGLVYGLWGLALLLALREGSRGVAALAGVVLVYATFRSVLAVARAWSPRGDR